MSPTSKVLLGAGAAGVAGYLLWRLWPTAQPDPSVIPSYVPTPAHIPRLPGTPTYAPPPTAYAVLAPCPPGTERHPSGVCIPIIE